MIKKFTLGYAVLFFFVFIWYILTLLFPGSDSQFLVSEFPQAFVSCNILGFITMVLCCIKLQQHDENYLVRVIPFYIILGAISSIFYNFDLLHINGFSTHGTILETSTGAITQFVNSSQLYILPLSALTILNPNNKISKILKFIGYIFVIATFGTNIWVMIQSEMIDVIPNVFSTGVFGNVEATSTLADVLFQFAFVVEIAVVCFGFIINYSLEVDTIQSENMDYEELAKQAKYVNEEKTKLMYEGPEKQGPQIDRSVSEATGYMNINNQLGANSNVGQVSKAATATMKEDAIDKNLISVGPVVNAKAEVAEQQQQVQSQPQPAPQPAPVAQPVAQTVQVPVQQQPIQQPVQQQPVEEINIPHVDATPTPVQNTQVDQQQQ